VLVGFALGHLFAEFVNNAFLAPNFGNHVSLRIEPLAGGALLGFRTVY